MISRKETKELQGVAILAMLCLHLFCTLSPDFIPLIYVTGVPLVYYIGQASDFCVMAYCFCSGYGLRAVYEDTGENNRKYMRGRIRSLFRFLQNYWLILFGFALVAVVSGNAVDWLGSAGVFSGNFITLGYSYNGAWWFVSTYIFMVLLSPLFFLAVKKRQKITAITAIMIYFVSYVARFSWGGGFWTQHISRLGMSSAELLIGIYFYEYKLMDKIQNTWNTVVPSRMQIKLLTLLSVIVIVVRRFVATLFVAPISGMIFILAYILSVRKCERIRKGFGLLGRHSTNIWLIHMFFINPQLGSGVYVFRYPILLLAALLVICLGCSAVIGHIGRFKR